MHPEGSVYDGSSKQASFSPLSVLYLGGRVRRPALLRQDVRSAPRVLPIDCMQRQDVHIGAYTLEQGKPREDSYSGKAHHTFRKDERSPVRDVDR